MNTRTFLGTAIAVILMANQHVESTSNICDSPKCLQEAAKISNYVDPNANPCEDFYQFACGNFLKNAFGDEELNFQHRTHQEYFRERVALYEEDAHEDDHKMVKVAKKLYRGCMKENPIQVDFVRTVRNMLHKVGGWPSGQGSGWTEEDFDWLNATYELRRLGYDHSAFLKVDVAYIDPENDDRQILGIDVGARSDIFINQTQLTSVLTLFGEYDENGITKDLTDVHEFLKKSHQMFRNNTHSQKMFTIEEIQKSDGVINWLEFITTLVGPKVPITKDDRIVFPSNEYIKQAIELISRTSKRTLANYLMWKVVEPLLRFIPNSALNPRTSEIMENRSKFCMKEICNRLFTTVPDPMDVMWHRRYLSAEKKKKMENMFSKLKSEFAQSLSKNEWIPEEDTLKLVDKVNKVEVMVGMPGNYFDDKMLDKGNVDMTDNEDDSFFALLARVNRNLQSSRYSRKDTSFHETSDVYLFLQEAVPHYIGYHNLLYVPVSASNDFLFDENRPEYLNYGTLGTTVGFGLSDILLTYVTETQASASNSKDGVDCFVAQIDHRLITDVALRTIVGTMIAEQISYAAYEEWVKDNGDGQKLAATDYTPNQLFWISAASLKCQPTGHSKFSGGNGAEVLSAIHIVPESVRHHPNFSKDFNCPVDSRMNPSKKCKIV